MSRLTNDLSAVRAAFRARAAQRVQHRAGVRDRAGAAASAVAPADAAGPASRTRCCWWRRALASRRIHRASRAIQDQLGTMSTAIQEDLAGIAVIKHYTLEESRQRAFRGVNDEYLARALALVRARGALMPLFAMLGGIGTLIVLWAGGREVIAGRHDRRQPGGVQRLPGAALVADVRARLDHRDLAARHRRLGARARAARRRGRGSRTRRTPAARARRAAAAPSVEVRDLAIAVDERRLLDGVSFELPAGATLAIVGPTGVGQDDAGRRPAAHAGGRAGRRPHRRPRRHAHPARRAARADRLRAPGRVPVLGDGRRQHRLRHPRRGRRRRRATSASGAPPKRPAWRPTSPCCPRATAPWSASAASPCRAGSGSGWRWRARWPPTRRS